MKLRLDELLIGRRQVLETLSGRYRRLGHCSRCPLLIILTVHEAYPRALRADKKVFIRAFKQLLPSFPFASIYLLLPQLLPRTIVRSDSIAQIHQLG